MSKERRTVEWSLDLERMKVRARQFVSDAMGGTAETKTASLRASLDSAASAKIGIAFPVGQGNIKALEAQSPKLFEAELTYLGDYDFDVSGAAERVISLRQLSDLAGDLGAMAGKAQDLRWDIALARNLPIHLSIAAGVGTANIDLSGLRIDALRLETGVGKALVTLPAQGRALVAAIRSGLGQTEVNVPRGAYGELDIQGGLGSVKVRVSQNIAARVEAKSGLGAIDLPERFVRVTGDENTKTIRVWQTANYADADQTMTINYAGGLGRFGLDTAE